MNGCGAQWYAYVPSLENVNRKASFGARSPESKTAVSDVAVWLIASEFFQQTVDPRETVTSLGWNAYELMSTMTSPTWQAPADVRALPEAGITVTAAATSAM
jgi:hypothetical protein